MLMIPVTYYTYRYLTYELDYCAQFGLLDGEIGWTLAPGTTSCLNGFEQPDGGYAFESTIFINADGARAPSTDYETPVGGVMIIGDSHSFGHGVSYEDTFAAALEQYHARSTAVFASPAYSTLQAMLLGRQAINVVRPGAIVLLEHGAWDRAVCTGSQRPTRILKPCFWARPDGQAEVVLPPQGRVEAYASFGITPGGMLGAGEKTLSYFLISRPLARMSMALVRLGLKSGFGHDFTAVGTENEIAAIRRAYVREISGLAQAVSVPVVLIDAADVYSEFIHQMPESGVFYVGADEWRASVSGPMNGLPPDEARVPLDGHYARGTNRLIADLIDQVLTREGI